MEIKAKLDKPYTEDQRKDFIVANNHVLGYEIREKFTGLEAWGLTDEEISQQEKQAHRQELLQQLDQLDLKTIRSLRAIQSGHSTQQDLDKLAELEQQAEQIRQEIRDL